MEGMLSCMHAYVTQVIQVMHTLPVIHEGNADKIGHASFAGYAGNVRYRKHINILSQISKASQGSNNILIMQVKQVLPIGDTILSCLVSIALAD